MGDDRVKKEAIEIMASFQVLPRLVVFDLDYTLWPFFCVNFDEGIWRAKGSTINTCVMGKCGISMSIEVQ
ncbi:hypothetical protein OROGR_004295 [Orobanche gracilis]